MVWILNGTNMLDLENLRHILSLGKDFCLLKVHTQLSMISIKKVLEYLSICLYHFFFFLTSTGYE